MPTTILFNGAKFAGQPPDPLESLLELLRREPLDPRFGTFYGPVSAHIAEHRGVDPLRALHFSGNFYAVSHAFSVYSDEEVVQNRLRLAIAKNRASDAYVAALRETREEDARRAEQAHILETRFALRRSR